MNTKTIWTKRKPPYHGYWKPSEIQVARVRRAKRDWQQPNLVLFVEEIIKARMNMITAITTATVAIDFILIVPCQSTSPPSS